MDAAASSVRRVYLSRSTAKIGMDTAQTPTNVQVVHVVPQLWTMTTKRNRMEKMLFKSMMMTADMPSEMGNDASTAISKNSGIVLLMNSPPRMALM